MQNPILATLARMETKMDTLTEGMETMQTKLNSLTKYITSLRRDAAQDFNRKHGYRSSNVPLRAVPNKEGDEPADDSSVSNLTSSMGWRNRS